MLLYFTGLLLLMMSSNPVMSSDTIVSAEWLQLRLAAKEKLLVTYDVMHDVQLDIAIQMQYCLRIG